MGRANVIPAIEIVRVTPGMVAQVVAVHEETFPDFFLTQLGSRFLRLYYAALVDSPSGVALAAKVEGGGVVGFAAGSTEPAGFYRRLLARGWLRFSLAALPAVIRRPSRAGRVLGALRHPSRQPSELGTAGLHSIATTPSAQGTGIGGVLIEAFAGEVERLGCTRLRLETDAEDNERVIDFYVRHGFEEVGEELRGSRRMLLMEREIAGEELT